MKWKTWLLIGGLAAWYSLTGLTSCFSTKPEYKQRYPLPAQISVLETSLPCKEKKKKTKVKDEKGNIKEQITLEKIIETKDIDFSNNFEIKTERYTLNKDKDYLISRIIGHIMVIPIRLFLWDWDIGWGCDEKRTRAALAMLENNKNLKDLTVRINHNEALYDMTRLFTDKKVIDRNPGIFRIPLGVYNCLKDEIWAEFFRGDYYNPLTQTVVVYSNIESIAAHEIGHHQDFNRFDSDWAYSLTRILPPAWLYQEWKASKNAKNIMSPNDNLQFYRYLLPAFLTYLLGAWFASKKLIQKNKYKFQGGRKDFDKLEDNEKPKVLFHETLRHFVEWNAAFYGGAAAYGISAKLSMPELATYAGFVGGYILTKTISKPIFDKLIPYEHK